MKDLRNPNISNASVCEKLVRAMVAASRGYVYPDLHIHAVKLAQVPNMKHKKIG